MSGKEGAFRVGELRPSQLLYAFGVGAVVDLPQLSVMVMGIDDWDANHAPEIQEDRLLGAVREELGGQVAKLRGAPITTDASAVRQDPMGEEARIGVPVSPFPGWQRCPMCGYVGPLSSELFELKRNQYRIDRTEYVHRNCPKAARPPGALPVRFVVACENGHLDDFPWLYFVHRAAGTCPGPLRISERGSSSEIADVFLNCDGCGTGRAMVEAFDRDKKVLPSCAGRRPHLRDNDATPCEADSRAILLGASNSWFPVMYSVLHLPPESASRLAQLVEENWIKLQLIQSQQNVELLRGIGQLGEFLAYSDAEIWKAIDAKRNRPPDAPAAPRDLKGPEWARFSKPEATQNSRDFFLEKTGVPESYRDVIEQVVLVKRLREVIALIGFTRIESPGDQADGVQVDPRRRAPLSRRAPYWVPANEVRGEGVFIQLREDFLRDWEKRTAVQTRRAELFKAHKDWRTKRNIHPPEGGFPELRYVILHTLAHVLMRQVALECGYTMASIRERIYAREPGADGGPMAGFLLYTAAPDSEGTLGGLVSLGDPKPLGRHLDGALRTATLCSSDPLCAEHHPYSSGLTLHGAACHACLFAPETSCERGNKYLDRSLLVPTFDRRAHERAFFQRPELET